MPVQFPNADFIRHMPKVELHLHLEGAFTFEYLLGLIRKYEPDSEIDSVEQLRKRFQYKDFPEFIRIWLWKNQYFREPEDFKQLVYTTLKNLADQQCYYVEAFYSPWDFRMNDISASTITEAMITGAEEAERDFGIRCRLIADLIRDLGWETAGDRLDEITPYLGDRLIGIGLGGSEQDYPADGFREVYREAKSRGFRVVAHAGEAEGPDSVRMAIDELHVERIGHGVRATEDPELVSYLVKTQLPLEVCITSNIKTGIYRSIEEHPVRQLFEQGVRITINSDDPAMFGTTLTNEFLILQKFYEFSYSEIKQLSLNAVESSFMPESEKENLRKKIWIYWQKTN